MLEQINVHARWAARRQSIVECAEMALACLDRLATIDDVFGHTWLLCGWSLDEARTNPVNLNIESLQSLMINGQNRDENGCPIQELGFSLGRLWNGCEKEAAHVTIKCGAFPSPEYLPNPNEVLIELPETGAASARMEDRQRVIEVIEAIVESFDPDWLRVSTFKVDEEIYGVRKYTGQKVGWMTYISDRYGMIPTLPEVTLVSKLDNRGTLIEIPTVTARSFMTKTGVSKLRALSEALQEANFLEPIPMNRSGAANSSPPDHSM